MNDEEPVRPIAGGGRRNANNRPQAGPPASDRRFVPLQERERLMNDLQDLRNGRDRNQNGIEGLFSNNASEE